MLTSATLVFLFAVALTHGQMDEDPECMPPHPPNKEAECCTVKFSFTEDNVQHDDIKKCFDEAGMKRPSGPPGSGSPPTAEEMAAHLSAHECADECIFKSSNLIKSDGELDQEAIKALATKMYTGDWAKVATATIEKCLASAKSEVGASAKCKSGAKQLTKCFTRGMFLGCPASAWTESTECAAAKARLIKCPNAMAPHPHPHHRH